MYFFFLLTYHCLCLLKYCICLNFIICLCSIWFYQKECYEIIKKVMFPGEAAYIIFAVHAHTADETLDLNCAPTLGNILEGIAGHFC